MRTEKAENKLTVFLPSEIDAQSAPTIQKEIFEKMGSDENILLVLDASELCYISSAGLKLIISAQKKLKNKISVLNISKEVMEIFKMVGFQHLVELKEA